MSKLALIGIPVGMLLGYFVVMVLVGLYSYKISKETSEDYYTGGRGFGTFVVIMTWAFTMWSTFTFYGAAGFFYYHGIGTWSIGIGTAAAGLLAATIGVKIWELGKRFGFVTPADLLGDRYPSDVFHLLVTAICIIFVMPYVGLQSAGIGAGLEVLTGGAIPYMVGTSAAAVAMFVYVTVGGMRAVAWTDAIKGVMVTVILISGTFWVSNAIWGSPVTGFIKSFKTVAAQRPEILTHPGPHGLFTIQFLIGYFILFSFGNMSQPQLWIRMYLPKRRISFWHFAILFGAMELLIWLWPPIWGFMGQVVYGSGLSWKEADVVLQKLSTDYMPYWFASLMLLGLTCAAMSTADSQLLTVSALTSKDLFKLHLKKDATESQMVFIGRIFVAVYVIIALLIAWVRPVMFIEFVSVLTWPATLQLMPATIGGLYWKRGSTPAALWGTGVGLAIVILLTWVYKVNPLGFSPAVWGVLVNAILYVAISYKTKVSGEVVQRYFK